MAAVRHAILDVEIQFFNGLDPFCTTLPSFVKIGQTVAEMS